jgi:thiol-disulfide isomerase/thioredoxin
MMKEYEPRRRSSGEPAASMKGSTVMKWLGIVFVVFIALVGCQKKETASDTNTAAKDTVAQPQAAPAAKAPVAFGPRRTGPEAPEKAQQLVGLTWIKGGPVTITPGTVYVVEFWATWCPPCKISIPHLTELQKKFKDKGVVFVGVSDEPPEVVKPFVEKMGDAMSYNVASDTQGAVLQGYMVAFQQGGIPTAFVVDATGKVVWVGQPLDEAFEKKLDKLAANKPAGQ